MKLDWNKLAIAVSALWALTAIPISVRLVYEWSVSGILMQLFALALVCAPIWLVYGWRWMSNGAPAPNKVWIPVAIAGALLSLFTSEYGSLLPIAPVLGTAVFLILVFIFKRSQAENAKSAPAKSKSQRLEQINEAARPLLQLTQKLSSELLQTITQLPPPAGLTNLISPSADAVKCVYALIYLKASDPSSHRVNRLMAFSFYRSHIVSNLAALMAPRIPGVPAFSQQELDNPEIRAPIKRLLDLVERDAGETRTRLASGAANPFFPIYSNLRPYVSPKATEADMSKRFEDNFAALFEQVDISMRRMVTARSS